MISRLPIQALVAFLIHMFISSCSNIKTEVDNTFTRDSKLIASKDYTGSWDYYKVEDGDAIAVHLHESHFDKSSFAGHSYRYITFQLPKDAKEGEFYTLNVVPSNRKAKQVGEFTRIADMKNLEVTGFQYGNPSWGHMKKVEYAKVKIISITKKKLIIHLKLKAKLTPHFSFDIDEQFDLKHKKPNQR